MPKNKKASDATTDKLLRATAKYIEEAGGVAIVIGGISVEKHDKKHSYTLRIDFLGKPPRKQN